MARKCGVAEACAKARTARVRSASLGQRDGARVGTRFLDLRVADLPLYRPDAASQHEGLTARPSGGMGRSLRAGDAGLPRLNVGRE